MSLQIVPISFRVLNERQKAQALKLKPQATKFCRFEVDRTNKVIRAV